MAAVLDALGRYITNLIVDMAQEEVFMLLGVSGEITKLEDIMGSIKAFLADAERRRITDQSVQIYVRKLKDAMYDATDILDLCQLEADKRRESKGANLEEKVPGCFQRLLFCLRNPVFAHEIGSRIKELNQRMEDIHKRAAQFNFSTNLSSYQDQRMLNDTQHSSLRTMSEFDETAIVGVNIRKDTRKLTQVLITHDNHDLKVVSILGMAGMGKTTLAQKIYKEADVKKNFKIRIWLSITQHFNEVELLRTAISHAVGHDVGEQDKSKLVQTLMGEQDKSKLVQTLTNTLSTSKFLVVMDDVWSDRPWNDVLSVPIKNASRKQPGSRVLVTTRYEDLPLKMRASIYPHHVKPLDKEDSWSLLKEQLPPNQVEVDQLKSIGMEILRRCEGLPLAIKVIGGVLSTKYPSESEWKTVLNDPAWSVDGLPPELDSRLYLSYEDLHPQLKQCFLYCTVFPKGTNIPLGLITSMWIAEGFIQPSERNGSPHHDDRLEDIATEYYRDLIKRNLIQPREEYSLTGYICTLHDVVRSFAERMAREEMLVLRDKQGVANLVRRLCIAPTDISVPDWAILKKQKSLRTLATHSIIKFMPGDSLIGFSSLRVLLMSEADFDILGDSLCHLKHLRLLYLDVSNISRLPNDIHKMKFLQFIFLLRCKKPVDLPSSIVKLEHLRCLDMYGTNITAVPKGFGGLTNLRSLSGFPVHVDDMDAGSSCWCSLQELAPLSQLRELKLYGLEKVHASWMVEKAMISTKAQLRSLLLNYDNSASGEQMNEQQQQEAEEVLEKLCPPTCLLETLIMNGGYVGRRLPNWMHAPASANFKSLRFLQLQDLLCCTQLPDGLCCLPGLEGLKITHAPAIKRIGPEFQASSSSSAARYSASISTPFPKLRSLDMIGLCEWEEWEWNGCVEQGGAEAAMAMPCLERLVIRNCKLSRLPPGLASSKRRALRELGLYELTNLASVENFPSVVELEVEHCPKLKRISGLNRTRLHEIKIVHCPNLEELDSVPALGSLTWHDEYLPDEEPRIFRLLRNKKLHESSSSPDCSECSHTKDGDIYCAQD